MFADETPVSNGTRFYFYPGTSELTFNSVKLVANALERTALSATESGYGTKNEKMGNRPTTRQRRRLGNSHYCISHGVCSW